MTPPSTTVGVEDGPSQFLFGEIRGVAVDGDGDLYVLDGTDHSIRRFTRSGRYVTRAGRTGRGPGDLAYPRAMWHDGLRTLYVVDEYNGISIFDTDDEQLRYRTRFAEGWNAKNICGFDEDLVVAAFHDEKVVQVFSAAHSFKRSFGTYFNPDTNPVVHKVANSGHLLMACDEELRRVFIAPASSGRVRSYAPTGEMIWETTLPDFLGSRTFVDGRGAVTTLVPLFITETLTRVGADLLVLQAHHQERRRSPVSGMAVVDRGVVTYVLSARDGTVLAREYGSPFIGHEAQGRAVTFDDDPYPRVALRTLTMIRR
jgi:hypothetical protein